MKMQSKQEREDCANCPFPNRKCGECINRANSKARKTAEKRAKKNAEFMYIYGGGRRAGRTYLRNMLLQAQASETKESRAKVKKGLLNFALQMNFAEIEIRAIKNYLETGAMDFPDEKERETIKIEKTQCASTCYSATCLICETTKILSIELNTMTLVCNKCYTVFNLEY